MKGHTAVAKAADVLESNFLSDMTYKSNKRAVSIHFLI